MIWILLAGMVLPVIGTGVLLWQRNMHIWLPRFLFARRHDRPGNAPVHVMFCFVDHYEPGWQQPGIDIERKRVDRWCTDYPKLAASHQDADGCTPKHSFFFPEEEYREEHLDKLVNLCQQGFGEIEVHLHHDNDTEAGLRAKLNGFLRQLDERHGALSKSTDTGQPLFGFIHGNWSLDNSRADGRMCGVNNELIVLRELGCYADFTLPSAPSETQTRKINSIYYAADDPLRPKSHNDGVDVVANGSPCGDLMIIQGPLGLDWSSRKWGVLPKIENGDIRKTVPPTQSRVDSWIKTGIHVKGRPEWIFVKIHTHGTQEADMDTLLGAPVDRMFSYLETAYNDGERHVLHYVSAREMYNIVKAAEAGCSGNPDQYRDYVLPQPPMLQKVESENSRDAGNAA